MSEITKKSIEYLASLARLELESKESDAMLNDLQKILNHFKELQEVDTEGILPMSGGTNLINIFREDEVRLAQEADEVKKAFPDHKNGFLKVPPVFEQ